jgi:hypothetical protein
MKEQMQNTNIRQTLKDLNGDETWLEQRDQHFLGCHEFSLMNCNSLSCITHFHVQECPLLEYTR